MNKIAIYTCITGAYDELQQPYLPADGFDFICFVGAGEKTAEKIGAWEIRELPQVGCEAKLRSRWAKLHPHLLLPDYEASLWIDGNILIADASLYEFLRAKFESGVLYSGVPHPSRDCVYEEARKCRDMKYLSNFKLLSIWSWLALNGIKRHGGLVETNLTYRKHLEPKVVCFDELWWSKVEGLCYRDQISVMWCLREVGLPLDYLLGEAKNARNFYGLKYLRHK